MSAEPMSLWTDDAITRAEEHADPDWLDVAERIVATIPRDTEFTTDRVWSALHLLGVKTHEPRALGSVMRSLARDGVIVNTGAYTKSGRIECHQRPIVVWART